MDKENKLILYKDENGKVSVNVRFSDEDVWLTQAQLVETYQSSKSNVSEHLKHIFEDGELDRNSVVRKFPNNHSVWSVKCDSWSVISTKR